MIVFDQIEKSYQVGGKAVPALYPTSFAIETGEVFGIVGHSGAGKSTLVRLINLLERPTGGNIKIDGEDITHYNASQLRSFRRNVGMIFQHFNLLSSKSVNDNIAFPMKLAGIYSKTEIRQRVAELLELVSLSDHATKFPSQLSGGQKQRVGIARALACRPTILLCDEATSALDPQTTQSVLKLLADINRELGLTIVLITHEMDVVRRVCDRVAVMDAGRVVEMGPVSDVFLHPQHPTTRDFVFESENIDSLELQQDFKKAKGRILRLTFKGESTYDPLLGSVARQSGVDFSIISGRIDHIKDTPYGQLTLALVGGNLAVAMAALEAADVHVEVMN